MHKHSITSINNRLVAFHCLPHFVPPKCVFFLMAIMLFIFFIFLRPPTTTARNPLAEVSSDDFLRSAAGYGEEKLSTVVVGGSLLCDVFLDGISNLQSNPITGMLLYYASSRHIESRKKWNFSLQN